MEQTLNALGGLLLKALPTFILVVALHFYLRAVFFRPLERALRQRHEATEGVRMLAETSLQKASDKAGQYEEALRAARAEIYREQEQMRREWQQEHATAVQQARANAEAVIQEARFRLAAEAEEARRMLDAESRALGAQIADAVLRRRVA